jgi:ABC-type amino acid transport substrate-binding protein
VKHRSLGFAAAILLAGTRVPARDLAEMKAKGALRVLFSSDSNAQTFSVTPGTEPGLERELLETFARLHRLQMKPVPKERFEDIIPALLRGEGDLIVGINDTEERRRQIDFTVEVMPSRHVVVTRVPDSAIVSLDALRAVRVGVVSGTTWEEAAVAAGVTESRLVRAADVDAMLGSLGARKVAAVVMSLADATLAVQADPKLQVGMFLGRPRRAAWAVRKSDPELKRALDAHLGGSRQTGAWSRLVVKYYGENALKVLDRARTE